MSDRSDHVQMIDLGAMRRADPELDRVISEQRRKHPPVPPAPAPEPLPEPPAPPPFDPVTRDTSSDVGFFDVSELRKQWAAQEQESQSRPVPGGTSAYSGETGVMDRIDALVRETGGQDGSSRQMGS